MIKKFLTLFFSFALLSLCGCKETDLYVKKVSQLRLDVLEYACEEFSLTAHVEAVESPIANDGIVGKSENVILFKLKSLKPNTNLEDSLVTFSIGENTYTKPFEFKQITSLLTCSFTVDTLPSTDLLVKLTVNGKEEEITLSSLKNKSTKDWTKAIDKLLCEEENLNLINSENVELRIRFIDNDGYDYWYVGIIFKDKIYSFLLDGETLEIIAKKEDLK